MRSSRLERRRAGTNATTVSGGRAGAPGDTADMLQYCAKHNAAPMCEQFDMKDINKAIKHVRDGNARYRAVLAN